MMLDAYPAMATFHIEQFGCRATQADGAAIESQLRAMGCSAAHDSVSADVVVINTCTVTAAADSQAREAIRKIHASSPATRIVVTGCYAQRSPEELAALPGVSIVVGNSHKPQIPSLVSSITPANHTLPVLSGLPVAALPAPILTGDIFDVRDVLVAPVLGGEGNHTRPTLKIQDGCNSRCSFCVIPSVRGKSRSLPPQTVVAEIGRLAESGFREIVLSGINLGSYGRDLSPRIDFLDLLRRVLDETPVERLRISSIEPLDVTQDLIALFASTDRIARHFHMPLQSGCDAILAAMHRWYRTEHYARRIELIREALPDAAIGADVIAGFPGESEAQHETTLRFIAAHSFTYLHVFSYSSRPGTKAAALPNQLPPQTIKNRARELRALAESKAADFRESQIGRTLRVLTLNPSEENSGVGVSPALSSNYLQIHLPGTLPSNIFVDAHVTASGPRALQAQIAEAATPSPREFEAMLVP
jgi:threonylcarbamoyladenosine tRNA methylthiotransferase MtaB